jgi:hypothetical protein
MQAHSNSTIYFRQLPLNIRMTLFSTLDSLHETTTELITDSIRQQISSTKQFLFSKTMLSFVRMFSSLHFFLIVITTRTITTTGATLGEYY